jgi:hypothetical protein
MNAKHILNGLPEAQKNILRSTPRRNRLIDVVKCSEKANKTFLGKNFAGEFIVISIFQKIYVICSKRA